MKNLEKLNKAFNYFKKTYAYKMGGSQTVVLPNAQQKEFDDREYYSGRYASKYNSNIKHDIIGEVKVSRKEYSVYLKKLKDREIANAKSKQLQQEKELRYQELKEKGLYGIENNGELEFIELSKIESVRKYFDAKRLAKTLDISVENAELLNSGGKTYVFATQLKSNKIVRLYHASLDCNQLHISFDFPSKEVINEFYSNRERWENATFAALVGQSENKNHFVC